MELIKFTKIEDNNEIYVNVDLIVCIADSTLHTNASFISMVGNHFMTVKGTPAEIMATLQSNHTKP